MSEVIRVRAPSRLHFGLFTPGHAGTWPGVEGRAAVPARGFGGVGLMVRDPGVTVAVRPAPAWSAEGPLAERALAFARRCGAAPCQLVVERAAPEHVGLGTGTQLGLAVARAVLLATAGEAPDAVTLSRLAGRGERSALGVHGFQSGGFLVEGGKARPDELSPLVARVDFPRQWKIVLAVPRGLQGRHGAAESQVFDPAGEPGDLAHTDAMCRLVLLGMLPALHQQDLRAFGAALSDFNRRAGELFRPYQGGVYAHPRIAEVVESLHRLGAPGVGQSSWGPAAFAVVEGDRADWMVHRMSAESTEVFATEADNSGATSRTRSPEARG